MCHPSGRWTSALAIEALGLKKFGDKGNMTKAEIDFLIDYLIPLKKVWPLPCVLGELRSVREPDGEW